MGGGSVTQARASGSEVLGQSASAAGLQSASFSIKSLMSDAFGASLVAHALSPGVCLCLCECVSRALSFVFTLLGQTSQNRGRL